MRPDTKFTVNDQAISAWLLLKICAEPKRVSQLRPGEEITAEVAGISTVVRRLETVH